MLVTGATGFIGSALTRRLVRDGALVHVLVRAGSSKTALGPAWSRVERHVGDLEDEASLAAAVRAARPEVVFHLAKPRDGGGFAREAALTRRLAAVLREHAPDLRRWVRTAHSAPARSEEEALSSSLRQLGLPVVTLELFLVYGPGMPDGDFPRSMALGARPRGLSGAVKDFVWIDDVVEAYSLASHASGVEGLTIPVGTGRASSEAEAAALLLRLAGSSDAPPAPEGPPAGHPADPSLARRLLGWAPRVQLEQGLSLLLPGASRVRPEPGEERLRMAPWLGTPYPGARALKPSGPWTLVAAAADKLQSGDAAAAARAADGFIARLPRSAVGPAMRALIAAHSGDRAQAERWLDAAGGAGWPLALRGLLRARWGELDAGRADLEATRRVERSAWACAARADAFNGAGRYTSALTELEHMRRALPGSPEPDLRASAIHLEQAQYEEAAERARRAARLAPKDPAPRRQLARVRFVEGDLAGAREAARQAVALAPGSRDLELELLRLCVLLDDEKAAEELLARDWPEALRLYWRGYALCRRRRFAEGASLIARARERAEDARFADTCAFHARVAELLSRAPARTPQAGKRLVVVGLGYRHPYQASVEVLWSLLDCRELFSNLSDSTVVDLLGLYGVPMRTIVFRRTDGQSTPCARIVMRAMKSLESGGVVTRGQPNYYGRLAYRLVLECRRRGIDCRIPPSVSIADLFPSLVGRPPGEALGIQFRDTNDLRRMDPRLAAVIYNFGSGDRRREASAALRSLFDDAQPCWLLGGSGQREYDPVETSFGRLGAELMRWDPAVTVLLPPKSKSS